MEPAADPARGDALDRAFEMWVHGGDDVLAVHHGHPDGPAILPAGVSHTFLCRCSVNVKAAQSKSPHSGPSMLPVMVDGHAQMNGPLNALSPGYDHAWTLRLS